MSSSAEKVTSASCQYLWRFPDTTTHGLSRTNKIHNAQSNLLFLQTLLNETQKPGKWNLTRNRAKTKEIKTKFSGSLGYWLREERTLWKSFGVSADYRQFNGFSSLLKEFNKEFLVLVSKENSFHSNEQLRIYKIVLNVALVNQSFVVCFPFFFFRSSGVCLLSFFYLLFSVFIAAEFVLSATGLQTP